MDSSLRILTLLSEAIVRINGAISLQSNQRNYLKQLKRDLTPGEKMLYVTREYFSFGNLIDGSTCLMKAILLINKREFNKESSLYDLWKLLTPEEKSLLSNETFRKYKKMHEYRMMSREMNIRITEISDPLDERNIDDKLKKSLELYAKKDERSSKILPETDFLSKFSIGLVRYFSYEYLFKGKLAEAQRDKAGNEVFSALKSISDEDDANFKKMMERYKVYIDESLNM